MLTADVPGTAWSVDPATKRLVVTVDSTVTQAEIAKIKETAGDEAAPCASSARPAPSAS